MDEEMFLARLSSEPSDDVTRLVYADWLEDSGQAEKAEFLRLTVARPEAESAEEKDRARQLQGLAEGLDTDWLAVVSRLAVENCPNARPKAGPATRLFQLLCDRRWEEMQETPDLAVPRRQPWRPPCPRALDTAVFFLDNRPQAR